MNKENSKKCTACEEKKSLEDFYSQKKYSKKREEEYMYYSPECKKCTKKRSWKNYMDDPTGKKKQKKIQCMRNYADTKGGIIKGRAATRRWNEKGKQKEYYQKNKEQFVEYRERYNTNKKHDIAKKEWTACKKYFNNSCAYCEISEKDAKREYGQKLHKEHVENNGANDLSNCVPACRVCNSEKHDLDFEFWYKERSEHFTEDRYNIIIKWLQNDHKKYIEKSE